MKKIILFLVGIMLLSTMVMAQGTGITNTAYGEKEKFMLQECDCEGLEGAMIQAHNQTQAQAIEKVMAKVSEQRMTQLQTLEGLVLEEDDEGIIKAEGKANAQLFGLIQMRHTYEYQIMEDGSMERVQRWNDFMFKLQEGLEAEE